VRHLNDLLLRRVRIGLLIPKGGKAHLKRIRKLCSPALPWSKGRWKREIKQYLLQWRNAHALPAERYEALKDQRMSFGRRIVVALENFVRKIFAGR
jgi:glycerol-3-phosphate dehydrogenase